MKTPHTQRGSITLGLIFGLGMLGLGIAATSLIFSTNVTKNNSNAVSGIRTLVTADGAAREGVYRALDTYSSTTHSISFSSTDLPTSINGTENARVSITGSWPVYEVRGVSNNHLTTRKIVADLDMFPSAFAFDQAVYTHGNIHFNGNVSVSGNVYATDGIDLGGSAEIDGDAYTPDEITTAGAATVTDNSVDNYPDVLPPEIDTTSYLNEAMLNGTHYPLGTGATASNIIKNQVLSGTYFIDDSADISGNNTDFTGTLVVTGNLSLTGGEYKAGSINPLVIYVGGNLTLSGNVTIYGIVYVGGETTFGAGTPTINGSLISVSGANKAVGGGNITINYDPTYAEAWNGIVGLDTESGTSPLVKNWHEE